MQAVQPADLSGGGVMDIFYKDTKGRRWEVTRAIQNGPRAWEVSAEWTNHRTEHIASAWVEMKIKGVGGTLSEAVDDARVKSRLLEPPESMRDKFARLEREGLL